MNYIQRQDGRKYEGYIFKIKPNHPTFEEALSKYKVSKVIENKIEATPISKRITDSKDVFIVHGHNEGLKDKIARFITQLKLNPIILHEQTNRGRTIIEKFEDHAESVCYAIVLLTDDDQLIEKKQDTTEVEMKPRARQNVIFEHGYFFGTLGRDKVCALYKKVEMPSDLSGVVYVELDDKEAWKLQLAREIKASGIDVDLNLAI